MADAERMFIREPTCAIAGDYGGLGGTPPMPIGPKAPSIRRMAAPFVAGFNGSANAADAVRMTARLAAGAGAPLVVAHAFAPGDDTADARAASGELLASVRETRMRLRSIAAHSAADGLRDVGRHEGAALLAVGRAHRGPAGTAVGEGVADQLVSHAPCPLLVVPRGPRGPTGVIGVAFDGRDESRAALAVARDLVRIVGARMVVLGVALGNDVHDVARRMRAAVEEAGHGSAECRTLHGPVGPALADACRDSIDLLVAGSRRYGPTGAVAAGSVSRYLARHAPCAVLVVSPGAHGLCAADPPTVSAA